MQKTGNMTKKRKKALNNFGYPSFSGFRMKKVWKMKYVIKFVESAHSLLGKSVIYLLAKYG